MEFDPSSEPTWIKRGEGASSKAWKAHLDAQPCGRGIVVSVQFDVAHGRWRIYVTFSDGRTDAFDAEEPSYVRHLSAVELLAEVATLPRPKKR